MKVLITGAFSLTPELRQKLEALGLEITFHADERARVEDPEGFEAVICNGLFLYNDIARFEKLRFIQLTSAGLDRVPVDYCREKGIRVENARGVYSVPMAEFALWGVLQLYKQGKFFTDNQRAHRWEKHRGLLELAGKTVCILGCGSVGAECAKRFEAFGCRVLGIATGAREQEHFEAVYAMDSLMDVLPQADIVVLTLPLTEQTKHLFSRAAFEAMKPGSVLVNLARGTIVDTAALIEALETKLGGAVLDVFEEEPLGENSPLWDMENVVLTPHNSFVGEGNGNRLRELVFQNLKERFLC